MTDELAVTLYGTHLGELVRLPTGRAQLRWSAEAEDRWGINSPVLSRHLRVGLESSEHTESFFGALLPEGVHLDRLATAAKTATNDLVGLFAHVGADLAGALAIGGAHAPGDPEELTHEEIALLLERADGFLVGGGGTALPGFQRKLTLTRVDGKWYRGNGSLPSTHILKPVAPDYRSALDSEHYLLSIARTLGLSPFETWVEEIAGRPVLVIERYDRTISGDGIARIHQEDAAQALGLPWGQSDKFERVNPGANLRAIAGLLDTGVSVLGRDKSRADRYRLLQYTVLNVAGGNIDAHAKNFSLVHDDQGRTRLAPYYDAAPLALDANNGSALAMHINGVSQLPDVTLDDLVMEAVSWGLDERASRTLLEETLEAVIEATRSVESPPSIERHVPGYVRGQARNLRDGQVARIPSVSPLLSLKRLGTPPS